VYPNAEEIAKMATWGTGVAHCPSSNQMIGAGLAPIREYRDAGVPVGIGCDGSSSTDSASLWMETRNALLLGRLRGGPEAMQAREALEMATLGGAQCLGREGVLGVLAPGTAADLVVWGLEGVQFAGAWSDPVEALLRCGPNAAKHTIINGRVVVRDGRLVNTDVEDRLARHETVSRRLQGLTVA
jgi:cytosine/adenosine deaminase-related metal-dependent hydrolase